MMTLGEIIAKGRRGFPEKVAIKFKGREWTYQELDAQTNRVANGLKKLGIGKGDRVGLLMINSPYFVISYFGIAKLGAIVVPINVMFKGGEVAYLLNDSKASVLVTAPMFMPMVGEIHGQLETVKDIIIQDVEQENAFPECLSLAAMLNGESDELNLDYSITDDDVAVFLYTSGTTGNPKGAMLTHDNLVGNADQTRVATDSTEDDITLCVLPMFHSFAWTTCVTLPLLCGGKIIVLESFVPQVFLNTIVDERITIIACVPTMYTVLLQVPNVNSADYARIRLAYSGGAALPMEVLKKFEEKYGVKLLEGYGLSECSPVCTVNPWRGVRKPGSIGILIPELECKIIDDSGSEVTPGSPGELLFKGRNVMIGYFNLPEATTEAMKDGWVHTGDIGYMDVEGYFFIVDRKKDLIIVGGLNVYPREIEEVLYTFPKVAEAAAVGAPDALRGEMVKAFIALKQGETAT
ncbi:MAG: long-chain-fatty-acid--CoA ligase, partial [Eubacteriales bacterium]